VSVVVCCVLCISFAYVAGLHLRLRAQSARLAQTIRREAELLEAVRVLTAASRDSSQAVLAALDRTVRVLDPAIDSVMIFEADGEDLACVYCAGPRTQHFAATRIRRDQSGTLPARAALCGHHVEMRDDARPVIPTDRSAVAIPMIGGDGLAAVVYASSALSGRRESDVLVRAVAQAASPYAVAADRETDRKNALFDGLTGLHAPRAFRVLLQEEFRAARSRNDWSIALWFIDTDHFKRVNDTLGHQAGDAVLQRMAEILREHTVAGVDVPARNGGDEFCAIVRNVEKILAIERAARFCEAVRESDFGIALPISASIGVAAYPYDADSAEGLLEAADAAMYHSKRCGRDRVSFAASRGVFAVYC
jgi:diguanylate cyclase (GGDEF)-like protein